MAFTPGAALVAIADTDGVVYVADSGTADRYVYLDTDGVPYVSATGPGDQDLTADTDGATPYFVEASGTPTASGGSVATVTVTATGGGSKRAAGGASATVTVTATGTGIKRASGGSVASVGVTVAGAGVKHAAGWSVASVTVTATGGGHPVTTTPSGGSLATVTVTATGAGTKRGVGGTTATVTVTATAGGVKRASGGSFATVTITATGGGSGPGLPSIDIADYLPPGVDPLTTHRVETWWVDLLDRHGAAIGVLDGAAGGSVQHDVSATIQGGGTLDVTDTGQVEEWLDLRVRIWWQVSGVAPWPLGTFLCSTPREQWVETGRSWQIDLLDKIAVLDADEISGWYALDTGTVVTDAVAAIITAAGETAMAITASTETLASHMVWEPGTSRLRVINDLLGAINYRALRADGYGRYVVEPYTDPAQRATLRDLTGQAIVLETWTREQDLAKIPNRVELRSAGDASTEGLVGVATNTDPASRLSTVSRGRTISHTETGVSATSQAVIDALATRRLTDLSTPAVTRTVQHPAIPLDLLDVLAHEGQRGSVQSWSQPLEVGALVTTTMREVA